MRLHRLRMTAFGPFAGTETVDFDGLTRSGLYLVQGATGAGKTSILDAVCFALYAAVPGSRAGSRGTLRSDHAEAHVAPRVELELTVSGRRLRITRSPAFTRPKKRGGGETTEPATVLLQEHLDGEWVAKGTRNDEVAQVIDDVVGLGLEQFVKVVMLPQGEFAAFLRATPEDRRALLERLFDTSRFVDVEDWLAGRRRDSGAALEASRALLQTLLQRVDDVLGDLDPVAADRESGDTVDTAETAHAADTEDTAGDRAVDGTAADRTAPDRTAATEAAEEAARESDQQRWTELDPDQVGRELEAVVSRVAELTGIALARVDAAAGASEQATTHLHEARRTLDLQRRAGQAREALAALEESAEARETAARLLERARRARELTGQLAGLDDAASRADDAAARVRSARTEAATVCTTLAATDEDTDRATVQLLADEVSAATALLTRAEASLERARAAQSRVREHSARVSRHEEELRQRQRESDRQAERRATLTAQLEALSTVAARLDAHRTRLLALRRVTALVEQRAQATDRITEVAREESELAHASVTDGAEVVRLHQLRIDGMAGELAAGLVDGQDCPVCGSAQHPRPAVAVSEVTAEQIEAAEQRAAASREAHEAARRRLAGLHAEAEASVAQLDVCLSDLGLSLDPARVTVDAVRELTDEATAAAAEAQEAAQARDDIEQELHDLATEAEATTAGQDAARAGLASARATCAAATAEAAAALDELAAAIAEHREICPCTDPTAPPVDLTAGDAPPTDDPMPPGCEVAGRRLPQISARHRRATGRLGDLVTALRDHESAGQALGRAREQLETALVEHGFADLAAARDAVRTDTEITELEQQLREFDRRQRSAEDVLADPDVLAALEEDTPDLDRLGDLQRAAREAHTRADRRFALYGRAERRLRSLAREGHEHLAQVQRDEVEHATLRDLADCVAGTGPDNLLRMRLSSFVLAARLEEVARHANERLAVMSDGRYSLRHSDARAARGARSGLGLRVTDAWTGIERETATLSGGEAFLASLALALGLGDAVRAEAGGLDLQTLFVDEGFGSLDEESLEHVMGVLDDLREGGRSVGIVSHVPELRQRIPAQVLVTKTPAGSHLEVRVGAPGDIGAGDSPAA